MNDDLFEPGKEVGSFTASYMVCPSHHPPHLLPDPRLTTFPYSKPHQLHVHQDPITEGSFVVAHELVRQFMPSFFDVVVKSEFVAVSSFFPLEVLRRGRSVC
jgi:hypothetical protein